MHTESGSWQYYDYKDESRSQKMVPWAAFVIIKIKTRYLLPNAYP
jgi:hypothetical protein